MTNTIDNTHNTLRARRYKEDYVVKLTWKVKWDLMISSMADENDIKCAIGYPYAASDADAIQAWISDNYSSLIKLNFINAARFITTELHAQLTAYYGHRLWQNPQQYEILS